jgi:hypothetical protein
LSLTASSTEDPTFLKSNPACATSKLEWIEKGDQVKKAFGDYQSAITETIESNLKLLDELPPIKTLKIEDIKTQFRKIYCALQKDKIFEKEVEISGYKKSLNLHLNSYFSQIFKHHENRRKQINTNLFDLCRLYFNSDLPLTFLKVFETAEYLHKDYLDILDRIISREQIKLITYRNNRLKFEKICQQHNKWVTPFDERFDKIESLRIKLIWYVDFCNCKTIDDILKKKEIKISNIDLQALKDLMKDLDTLNKETEALIEPKLEFKPKHSADDNSANVIKKIVTLLQMPRV